MIIIPAGTTIIGELRSRGRIRVDGHIEGNGDVDGMILITKDCVWKGKVTADVIIIEGTVEGEIIARKRMKISKTASIAGNISCPAMLIEEGASITGRLRMRKPDEPVGLLENKGNTANISDHPEYKQKVKKAAGE